MMTDKQSSNHDYRTSLKTINFSYFNANKSTEAIRELTLTRPHNILYIISEVALNDHVPVPIPGYYSIYDDSDPTLHRIRTCAYLKESAADCLESFRTTPNIVTIDLVDNWTITGCYIDPTSPVPSSLLTPLTDKQIIMGDFNTKHQQWFDVKPNDNSQYLARGRTLAQWSKRCNTVERGPREATRHQEGYLPSKLNLLWTTRHRTNFMCNGYFPNTRSDHCVISARLRLIRNPKILTQPRPDYKRMDRALIQDYIESHPPPDNSSQLDTYLQRVLQLIPTNNKNPVHRLPPDLITMRCSLRHLMKTRWGNDEYRTLGHQYRDALTNHINAHIEDTLENAKHPEIFQFSKRGTPSKPVPTLTFNGRRYSGHEQIARCLAEYHGARPKMKLVPVNNPDIPPVLPSEVTEHLNKAPPNSANGPDLINAEVLKLLHASHPTCLSNIYTHVLQSGRHPQSWKTATVIPIPKANKPNYTTPKSWRSIHLLNIVSKTLERIVLSRLQSYEPLLPQPMGPSQFGSRINRGTSDAMQALIRWQETARSRNHYVTLVASDIEGGFDQGQPSRLPQTDINPLYISWIQHWASDRQIRFRHNNRSDLHTYITNRGIPQGSPLSPFLFGAYIKEIVEPPLPRTLIQQLLLFHMLMTFFYAYPPTPPRKSKH